MGVIPIYTGFDPREEAGYHVFASSVIERSSEPVGIMPLHLPMFRGFYNEGQRDGTNAFIYTRFLIPFLQNFRGWALFCDGADMLCRGDIADLWDMRHSNMAVQVAKHDYKPAQAKKYIGTKMEAENAPYVAKNWSSVMLINCEHFRWRCMTPEAVATMSGHALHRFSWINDDAIGSIPLEWNWLDEYGENPAAKIVHWTNGVPAFPRYKDAPHADEFRRQLALVNHVTD